jgi:hypothetical protein
MNRCLCILWIATALCAWTLPVAAVPYYPDPVLEEASDQDPHPMAEMINLAKDGDARAQFILGDLYSKGKGGLAKNEKKARYWFETSARNGYAQSFIRLAALAKRRDNFVDAYKWYTLGIEKLRSGPAQKFAIDQRNRLAMEKKLDRDDIRTARADAEDWKRRKENEEREARRIKQQQETISKKQEASRHEQN